LLVALGAGSLAAGSREDLLGRFVAASTRA
jgi:hypothetical protein